MPKFPITRAQLPEGDCLCNHCTALCCRYFSMPIKSPRTWDDFDRIHWYLQHGKIALFVEDGTWYLVVFGACRYLTPENMCGIYVTRPVICGQYTTDGCEYDNDFVFDQYFETPAQILEYAEAILPPRTSKPKQYRSRTFMIQIDTPTNWDDFDNIRWYMTHGRIAIYVEDRKWFLIAYGDDESQTAEIFNHRPATNRGKNDVTERLDDRFVFGKYFEAPEQLWEYAEAIFPPREPLERDKPQNVELPVLNAV